MAADLNDPDLIAAGRKARQNIPSVSGDTTPPGQSPAVQQQLDAIRQKSAATQARAAANRPGQPTVSETSYGDLAPNEKAAFNRAYGPPPAAPQPISTAEAIRNSPDSAFARQNSPLETNPAKRVAGGFEPESGTVRPSVASAAPAAAEVAPTAGAATTAAEDASRAFRAGRAVKPLVDAAGSAARFGLDKAPGVGVGRALGINAVTDAATAGALTGLETPTEAYVKRGVPDFGAMADRTVANGIGPGFNADLAHTAGDIATRGVGVLSDVGASLINVPNKIVTTFGGPDAGDYRNNFADVQAAGGVPAGGDKVSPNTLSSLITGAKAATPSVSSPATGATAATPASGAAVARPGGATNPTPVDSSGIRFDPTTAQLVADGAVKARGGTFNGRQLSDADVDRLSKQNVISSDNFRNPSTETGPASGIPSVTGGYSGGEDTADAERRSVMRNLQEEHAARNKQLSRYAQMAENELLKGHKRAAAGFTALAGIYDRGSPDYQSYLRGNRNNFQSNAQKEQEEAKARELDAQAFGQQITAQQHKRILDLQKQADAETDPDKRAALLDRIDTASGQAGRRFQLQRTPAAYDDFGHVSAYDNAAFDQYTGKIKKVSVSDQ